MKDLTMLLDELKDMSFFNKGDICLIGCSTSEVIGEKIGTVGSMEVAETIFNALDVVSKETGVTFAFQGCEHINRAITIEKSQYNPLTMEEVSVVPDVHAWREFGNIRFSAYEGSDRGRTYYCSLWN